ncbi:MAG: bifunctional methylenetetrahydrofolate dehydrogenase/methenyltetrahydrofolate cyclohydrolase [Treponema sp.]|jgi:5,10-methylene-tetrahydrofolate dehydrogenase/methenyl tetrahydrofolate cyclohydrolase|nr:bifunctional methylenetetrahydrofolate dehydrogenase/methenyltetrahydrofolate cyclohydrolase [Treponema sp.]
MVAIVIGGKAVALSIRACVKERAAFLRGKGILPCLAVILPGEDPASFSYVGTKEKAPGEAGTSGFHGESCFGPSGFYPLYPPRVFVLPREGAAVIDMGVNRVRDTSIKKGCRLRGDLDYEAHGKGRMDHFCTGGAMTSAMFLQNAVEAAEYAL